MKINKESQQPKNKCERQWAAQYICPPKITKKKAEDRARASLIHWLPWDSNHTILVL